MRGSGREGVGTQEYADAAPDDLIDLRLAERDRAEQGLAVQRR